MSSKEKMSGRKFGSTNQAKNSQAISGDPLNVSMKIMEEYLTTGNELALPIARIMPKGNPANIAITAKIIFTKKPPHKVTFGPPNKVNINNIEGKNIPHEIHKIILIYFP